MVAFVREDGAEYRLSCSLVDVNQVCNQEKTFPREWITDNGTNISPEFLTYALFRSSKESPPVSWKTAFPSTCTENKRKRKKRRHFLHLKAEQENVSSS